MSGFGRGVLALTDGVFAGRTALQPRQRTGSFAALTEVAGEFPLTCWDDEVAESDLPRRAAVLAAEEALAEGGSPNRADIELVLATTKADMSGIVGETTADQAAGWASPMRLAQQLVSDLGLSRSPTALSCACASGVLAVATAARRIKAGECSNALAVATDALNQFILAGFGGLGAARSAALSAV